MSEPLRPVRAEAARAQEALSKGDHSRQISGGLYRQITATIGEHEALARDVLALVAELDQAESERDQAVAAMREIQRRYLRTDKA